VFQNLLVWKQHRSLCQCSSLAAFLMPVASLLRFWITWHASYEYQLPITLRLLPIFLEEDHKCNPGEDVSDNSFSSYDKFAIWNCIIYTFF
jgi:hypothetical protein